MRLSLSRFFIIVTVVFVASCKDENTDPIPFTYEYFPVSLKHYVIYDVDSVYHSDNDNNNDDSVYTWHFQVKERLDSNFIDGEGRQTQRIMRYRRSDSTQAWTFMNVWTQTRTTTVAYRNEDNIVYHKFVFPVTADAQWDGNGSNTFDEELYEYESLHVGKTVGGIFFDSTVSVLQREEDNFVERIYGYEVYATGVGMVFKQRDNLRKQGGQVAFGTEYKMTIHSFGVE